MRVKADIKGLSNVLKALSANYKVRVGILSNDKSKSGRAVSKNAQIGLIQEFGSLTRNIPARSFLRMPLETHLADELKGKKAFDKKAIEKTLKAGNGKEIAISIGLAGEIVIDKSFETHGWGKWEKNKPATIRAKGSDSPLIDTGELRRSITSDIKK
jgi:phage gpG-like protein